MDGEAWEALEPLYSLLGVAQGCDRAIVYNLALMATQPLRTKRFAFSLLYSGEMSRPLLVFHDC